MPDRVAQLAALPSPVLIPVPRLSHDHRPPLKEIRYPSDELTGFVGEFECGSNPVTTISRIEAGHLGVIEIEFACVPKPRRPDRSHRRALTTLSGTSSAAVVRHGFNPDPGLMLTNPSTLGRGLGRFLGGRRFRRLAPRRSFCRLPAGPMRRRLFRRCHRRGR
jgi:hypothetical protein